MQPRTVESLGPGLLLHRTRPLRMAGSSRFVDDSLRRRSWGVPGSGGYPATTCQRLPCNSRVGLVATPFLGVEKIPGGSGVGDVRDQPPYVGLSVGAWGILHRSAFS